MQILLQQKRKNKGHHKKVLHLNMEFRFNSKLTMKAGPHINGHVFSSSGSILSGATPFLTLAKLLRYKNLGDKWLSIRKHV